MADFVKGPSAGAAPFGRNEFLRSVRDVKTESFTFSAASLPTEVQDGTTMKILQPGTVLAKITSGAEAGKVGAFQAGATDGRQTLSNIVGLNMTFLPWQLIERDVEVASVVEARVVQGWCFELDSSGVRIPLSNTTAAAMVAQKSLSLSFA